MESHFSPSGLVKPEVNIIFYYVKAASSLVSPNAGLRGLPALLRLLALIMAMVSKSVLGSTAVILEPMEPVSVLPGDLLKQRLIWQRKSGARVEIRLLEKTTQARLSFDADGELWINWQTNEELPDESILIVVARDIDTGEVLEQRELKVYNANVTKANNHDRNTAKIIVDLSQPASSQTLAASLPVQGRSQESVTKPDNSAVTVKLASPASFETIVTMLEPDKRKVAVPDETVPARLVGNVSNSSRTISREVSIEPIASQIVSVGRAVAFRVQASAADDTNPDVSIDRLPRNASFEPDLNGSYSFFWQTGPKDQGEHRFRLVARHVNDSKSKTVQDVVVVVGDPTAGSTKPEDFQESGS